MALEQTDAMYLKGLLSNPDAYMDSRLRTADVPSVFVEGFHKLFVRLLQGLLQLLQGLRSMHLYSTDIGMKGVPIDLLQNQCILQNTHMDP